MKYFLLILLFLHCKLKAVLGGCCNNNFWCDGDPSFREKPDVKQEEYSLVIDISWKEAALRLAKCVDYYFVEFAELPNGTYRDDGSTTSWSFKQQENATEYQPQFAKIGVRLTRKNVTELRDFVEHSIDKEQTRWTNFAAQITEVNYNTTYIIRAVAIDKGLGWGDHEGFAEVKSKEVVFRSRIYQAPPDPVQVARRKIEERYPPQLCREHQLCVEFAQEWAEDVTKTAIENSLRYNDPVDLDSLAISEDGKDEVEVYEAGQLKNLRSASGEVSEIEVMDDHTVVNITVRVRLLRTSYLWTSSFFTQGILSMYYTCGQKLPLAIFKDVDEEEVEEAISDDCQMEILVQLKVPIYTETNEGEGSSFEASLPRSPAKSAPTITLVNLGNFTRDAFKFDVTWFTESFHLLDQIWSAQSAMLRSKLPILIRRSFKHAVRTVNTDEWIKNKFRTLDAEIAEVKALSRITDTRPSQSQLN